MKVIERILSIANEKNIKEVEIAKAIDKGTGQITNWKTRGTTPPAELLPAIAKLLDVSLEYIITGTEKIIPGTVLPDEEQQLLDYYNAANQEGKKDILKYAKYAAQEHPSNLTIFGEETG